MGYLLCKFQVSVANSRLLGIIIIIIIIIAKPKASPKVLGEANNNTKNKGFTQCIGIKPIITVILGIIFCRKL